jgi:hypothetical protein
MCRKKFFFRGVTTCNLFCAVWKFGVCLASPPSADHPQRVDAFLMTLSAMQTVGCSLNNDPKRSCHDEICSDLSGRC